MLPQDVFDLIAIFSGQANVFHTFKHQLTPQVYDALKNVDDWDYAQIEMSLKFFYFSEVLGVRILDPRIHNYILKKEVGLLE
jgi:hypothetical protein